MNFAFKQNKTKQYLPKKKKKKKKNPPEDGQTI